MTTLEKLYRGGWVTWAKEVEEKAESVVAMWHPDESEGLSVLESGIDRLVYQLYRLTDDEIQFIESMIKTME